VDILNRALEDHGYAIPGWGHLQLDLEEVAAYAAEQQERADGLLREKMLLDKMWQDQLALATSGAEKVVELQAARDRLRARLDALEAAIDDEDGLVEDVMDAWDGYMPITGIDAYRAALRAILQKQEGA